MPAMYFIPRSVSLALLTYLLFGMPEPTEALHRNLQNADNNWRNVLEGIDGYPAGNMLEIALRRTQDNKIEMFKWMSEFIAMLGVQPGPLVQREWKSLAAWPPLTGAGTWTGMTWWENQQAWHDMANMIFPSPVTANWLSTINITLCHVRPNEDDFDLTVLAQSAAEVLEIGILAYPSVDTATFDTALGLYLDAVNGSMGATGTFTFDFFNNAFGFPGPFTTYYNANGGPNTDGSEAWKVYMAVWTSLEDYESARGNGTAVATNLEKLQAVLIEENSSIDVTTRSASKVCCKSAASGGRQCVLDPEECNVGVLGYGNTWAANCAQCPWPCATDYGVCSMLSTKTCLDIGGNVVDSCSGVENVDGDSDEDLDGDEGDVEAETMSGGTRRSLFGFHL